MAAKITPEMEKEYLESNGAKCLFCKSDNIEAGKCEADGPEAVCEITCLDCDEVWRDCYSLVGVLVEE
jgi:hypothetical protein